MNSGEIQTPQTYNIDNVNSHYNKTYDNILYNKNKPNLRLQTKR